jgi:hypothetical protein
MTKKKITKKKPAATTKLHTISVPDIGTHWKGQGGIFAGLMRGRDGEKDYALILGPALERGTFDEVSKNATTAKTGGHKDFRLPKRNEQSLLYANLKDKFKPAWYWSCERPPANESYAYAQYFNNGHQYAWGVYAYYLGVAVRVVNIQ